MKCLGLEQLLARDIQQKSKEADMARKHNRNAVLNVQHLQRRYHVYSLEDLASMAKASSREARMIAHRNAFGFLVTIMIRLIFCKAFWIPNVVLNKTLNQIKSEYLGLNLDNIRSAELSAASFSQQIQCKYLYLV